MGTLALWGFLALAGLYVLTRVFPGALGRVVASSLGGASVETVTTDATMIDVAGALDELFLKAPSQTFIIVEDDQDRFTQYMRYRTPGGMNGVEGDVPRMPWSEPYFDRIAALARDMSLKQRIEPGSDGCAEFLDIDFGMDRLSAQTFARRVHQEIYGSGSDARYRIQRVEQ